MELKIVAVYDTAVAAYMRPFSVQSVGQGVRSFEDEVMAPDSPIGKHPEDYSLFMLGSFDERSGKITVEQTPVCIAKAHEVKALATTGQLPIQKDGESN